MGLSEPENRVIRAVDQQMSIMWDALVEISGEATEPGGWSQGVAAEEAIEALEKVRAISESMEREEGQE